jgi:hypothetical protein
MIALSRPSMNSKCSSQSAASMHACRLDCPFDQPRLQAMGRHLQQRRRPHLGPAGPPAAPRRDRAHRGQELPLQGSGRGLTQPALHAVIAVYQATSPSKPSAGSNRPNCYTFAPAATSRPCTERQATGAGACKKSVALLTWKRLENRRRMSQGENDCKRENLCAYFRAETRMNPHFLYGTQNPAG